MFGGTHPDIYRAAASLELAVLSLDIIDDLQDQDHRAMPWCQSPPPLSLNVAIALLTAAISHCWTVRLTGSCYLRRPSS
ncbi:hypothetical protein D3C71_1312800 [compost metagenome]